MEETTSADPGPSPTTTQTRRRRAVVPQATLPKVGMEKNIRAAAMKKISASYYERRQLLTVPQEILDANPDKHFVYLNMNRLEKNGFWHEKGYECFKAKDLEDKKLVNKFNRSPDGFVHRNEMVLAWIPKEEHESREMEEQVMRGQRDIGDIIKRRPELSEFAPKAKYTSTEVPFPVNEQTSEDGNG